MAEVLGNTDDYGLFEDEGLKEELENGRDPEDILGEMIENGNLTEDWLETNGALLMENGLKGDTLDEIKAKLRSLNTEPMAGDDGNGSQNLEQIRKRSDEEGMPEGWETKDE